MLCAIIRPSSRVAEKAGYKTANTFAGKSNYHHPLLNFYNTLFLG
jgi:hypothetical protein